MAWKVAEAKQKFSLLLREAAQAPQIIRNRDRVVGAMLGPEDARAFFDFRGPAPAPLADTLHEAREICEEDGADLVIAPRVDRLNMMQEPERARRHKRRK